MTPLQGVGKAPYPLPLRPPVMGLVPFLAGQLVGSLAEPFHGFQLLPHGLHVDAVHLLLGGQQVDLAPPFLGSDFLTAGFQFFQIPGRRVIEDQFPAVALLEQFPLLRLLSAERRLFFFCRRPADKSNIGYNQLTIRPSSIRIVWSVICAISGL